MPKTYTADQVAKYFLAKAEESGDLISNLKLQKLCYYAQGIGLATRGQALFSEPLSAWMHGPVIPALYRQYRGYGSDAIQPAADFDLSAYDAADRLILDDVFSYFGQYTAWRLREMTHAEEPWKNNYDQLNGGQVIPLEEMASFFTDLVSDEYRQKYEQVSKSGPQAIALQRQDSN